MIKKDVYFISFITLLILNMLILFLGIYSHFFKVTNYTLIAGIIGFVGAVLGGVISGFLTLKGVRLTIKLNKDKDLYDSLPTKLMDIEDIILILERQHDLLVARCEKDPKGVSYLNPYYTERIKYILEYLEKDGLLKKAANVNIDTYRATRRLYNYIKKISYSNVHIYPYDQINSSIKTTIEKLKIESEKLIKIIDA